MASRSLCLRCQAAHAALQPRTASARAIGSERMRRRHDLNVQSRARSFTSSVKTSAPSAHDIVSILSKPTWSVRSLLPPESGVDSETSQSPDSHSDETITPARLAHLLRLSALPQPSSPEEAEAMLGTLRSQLHFVRAVRAVDTTGVEPLAAIRDETTEGREEATIGLAALRDILDNEDKVGVYQRPRRKLDAGRGGGEGAQGGGGVEEGWDPLAMAARTEGRYYVVKTGSKAGQ